jgi:hypothetical protein
MEYYKRCRIHSMQRESVPYCFKICLEVIKEFPIELALVFPNSKQTIFVAVVQNVVHRAQVSSQMSTRALSFQKLCL